MDFAKLNKAHSKRFNDQKALVKKVLAGKQVNCPECSDMLVATLNEEAAAFEVSCQKGCTLLTLEIG